MKHSERHCGTQRYTDRFIYVDMHPEATGRSKNDDIKLITTTHTTQTMPAGSPWSGEPAVEDGFGSRGVVTRPTNELPLLD